MKGYLIRVSLQIFRSVTFFIPFLMLLPAVSFSQAAPGSQSLLGYITETVKTSYECLTYECHRNKVPEILNVLQVNCEAEKVKLGCSRITDKDPSEAKYIRSCNFRKICERKLLPSHGLNVVACLRGAANVYTDYAELLKKNFLFDRSSSG